jgi:nucleoside-diphosphate-sugar epimerase
MRAMIWGSDGYLGWPTAMQLANLGHDVVGVDNYLKRTLAHEADADLLLEPHNLPERVRLFAARTGRMIRIGIADLRDPARAHDLLAHYHPETVVHYAELDTDLMQGPVYRPDGDGGDDRLLPALHYDDIFWTVLNRFLVQTLVVNHPLTVYGRGEQKRRFLDIRDTLGCVTLALEHPRAPGELRIYNQFTERVAAAARLLGLEVRIDHEPNPQMGTEEYLYEVRHEALLEFWLVPHLPTQASLVGMLERLRTYVGRIDGERLILRVHWRSA